MCFSGPQPDLVWITHFSGQRTISQVVDCAGRYQNAPGCAVRFCESPSKNGQRARLPPSRSFRYAQNPGRIVREMGRLTEIESVLRPNCAMIRRFLKRITLQNKQCAMKRRDR
jgi:hypothetical protein